MTRKALRIELEVGQVWQHRHTLKFCEIVKLTVDESGAIVEVETRTVLKYLLEQPFGNRHMLTMANGKQRKAGWTCYYDTSKFYHRYRFYASC